MTRRRSRRCPRIGANVIGGGRQVAGNGALGVSTGGVTIDGGGCGWPGRWTSARALTIDAGGGALDTQANTRHPVGRYGSVHQDR